MDLPEDALVISRVEIVRYLSGDRPGDIVLARAVDGNDKDLPLIESLGMLRVAEVLVLRMTDL